MHRSTYVIALGSNRPHGRYGRPEKVVRAALDALEQAGVLITVHSSILSTPPIGPSLRRFANSVAIIETAMSPPALLDLLKSIEGDFGRRRGRRWGARVIDLDIILWSGGAWASDRLFIPHREFRVRSFVLAPLNQIAPDWRDPLTNLTVAHLLMRLSRRTPVDRSPRHP